jgi:DNA-binding XRE family transcriptional regulator
VAACAPGPPVTDKQIVRLRGQFGMSQSELASLFGVSAPAIGNWEKNPGTLVLRPTLPRCLGCGKQIDETTSRKQDRWLKCIDIDPLISLMFLSCRASMGEQAPIKDGNFGFDRFTLLGVKFPCPITPYLNHT